LLVLWGQLLFSANHKSATMDEPYHMLNGVLWFSPQWKRIVFMGNPPLGNVLQALPLVALDEASLPGESAVWRLESWREFVFGLVRPFLWQVNGERASRLIWLARLPVMGLTLLLAAGVYRWACDVGRPPSASASAAGLLALTLALFEPNLLAHGRLATTDLAVACAAFWAAYLYWRYTRRPSLARLLAAGGMLGLALASKFSALLLLPAFGVLSLWPALDRDWRGLWRSVGGLALIVILAALVLLAAFRFQPRALWAEFDFQRAHFGSGHAAFLLGQHSRSGWWYYFPVALALKTPLPLLILSVAGTVLLLRRGRNRRVAAHLLLPPAIWFGASLFSEVNIGFRYLLPVVPFLCVLGGCVLAWPARPVPARSRQAIAYALLAFLVGWQVVGTLRLYPHYLAYFNELAGGPAGGWRALVDSNLDWGQDLPGLAAYLDAREVETPLYLSWFGITPPETYGIHYTALPNLFPSRDEAAHRVLHPGRPLPGTYAISATHLQGVYLGDPDKYAWFRARAPEAVIGHSIFVYDVPAVGETPASLALSGVSLDEIDTRTLDGDLRTNDLATRWFDARGALVFARRASGTPAARDAWFAVGEGTPLDPALRARFLGQDTDLGERASTGDGAPYRLYHLPGGEAERLLVPGRGDPSPAWWSDAGAFPEGYERHPLDLPVKVGQSLSFLGYELVAPERQPLRPGDEWTLLTFWQVEEPFAPRSGPARPGEELALFVHLLDRQGQVRAQHDGLSVDPVGLQAGDVWVHVHRLVVPQDAAPGSYPLAVGAYRPDTWERWGVYQGGKQVSDRMLLDAIEVE
jgi:4-amino-4-deoxy-L-arabinose transferase-like glycosyltransferase